MLKPLRLSRDADRQTAFQFYIVDHVIYFRSEKENPVRLLACIRHRAFSRCTRARSHALVHYFTHDLNLMLADITHQAFIKYLLAILIHE